MPIKDNIISPDEVPFKISDDGFYLDGSLTAIVNGSCYDFMGRQIFTTGFFRRDIGFGITNIDIEINQSLQPIVTITFKDLYGNVVFGKKQAGKDVPDYSVLFNWPPPKFLFTFKGYLGKQVSWMLNLKKTGTSYQQDGSYEIKCEFVPNQWGFMGDLPFLFLLAVKGLKRKELSPEKFKRLQTIFDLIKIGKKVEVKTKEVSNEFDSLLQQMTLIKSGRLVEAICYSGIIRIGEEIDGTAGNLKITGNSSLKFAKVTINPPSGYETVEKIKEYSATSAEALRKMNTFLFLNASIGGASDAGVSSVDAVSFDSGAYKEDKSRERTSIISNNIKLIEDAIKQRAFESSKSQLRQITIGEIFKQLAQDSGYILGKILEAGQKGLETNPDRIKAAEAHNIIGVQFPLMIDPETNEEVPASEYGVDDNEMAFVNEFVSAVSEGVALDLVQDDQSLGLVNDTQLVKRINNVEAPKGNPYAPFFRNIAQNVMIRAGIIAFLTRSNDPNYPGDYDTFWGIDRESIEQILELAAADMENVTEGMLSQLTNSEYIQLRQFCNYWTRLMTEDGLYYLDDEGNPTSTEIPTNGFEDDLDGSLLSKGVIVDKASSQKRTLENIFDQVFGANKETDDTVGSVIDNSSALYINRKSMQSQAVYNNRILYRVPKTESFGDDYAYVLFQGPDATKAKEASSANSDAELKGENADETLLGIVPIDTFNDSENNELGRVTLINERFSIAVMKYSEMANPPRLAWKDEAGWLQSVVYPNDTKIVNPSSETPDNEKKLAPSSLAVAVAFHPYSGDLGLVFGPFYETSSGRNHRAAIKKMCSIILEKMSSLEEQRNKVISSVVGKAEEGKNALYKQFHVLFHQWEVLMYDDPSEGGDCSSNPLIGYKTIVNTLEERYGGANSKERHVAIKQESRKEKIKTLDSNVFIYDCAVSDVANIDVRNSLINIEPLYNPDGNTTVLNMIQQICTKNNFTFVAVPGNGDFNDYSEVFKPHPSKKQKIQNLFYILFSPTPENRTTLSNSSSIILSQAKSPVLNTEAFEVKVGSPSNKIFKGVTIDSAENKPTAESVLNLQKLTDNENPNKKVGIECSTLPVMEGKSYMAGFTMLGNAQIFPMQYFYLNSIPLFNGIYQIKKVKHSITPNDMTTTAEGMRMRMNLGSIAAMRPITLETFENLGIQIDEIDASDFAERTNANRPVQSPDSRISTPLVEASSAEEVFAGTPSGEYIPYEKLSNYTKGILNLPNRLVVVREFIAGTRTAGTMWYNKKVIGFTVEDVVRTSKQAAVTAIPEGAYFVALDTTGNDFLTRCYVRFPNDSRAIFRSPGVLPRVGTTESAVVLNNKNFYFEGVRIHNGTDEKWSEGCIIYSSERLEGGRLKNDVNHCKALTKLIYEKDIKRIVVIDEFKKQ